ncbi:MAG: hypothetical protein J0H15_01980 [Xanthomonadales bacterium]|nr:hypothetical protein [Xanthomonadales bacterium]
MGSAKPRLGAARARKGVISIATRAGGTLSRPAVPAFEPFDFLRPPFCPARSGALSEPRCPLLYISRTFHPTTPPMSRWKAAGIHLSISLTIGVAAALLIFGLWYPPPYARATGAPELVMLLLGVDLTLGPLLTLVVFKAGKKGMRFDLAVIGIAQACALLYGLSVVARARPVYIVGAVDRFTVITANELDPKDVAEGAPGFRSVPWTGPKLVGAKLPANPAERTDLLFSSVSGKDLEARPRYYVPYEQAAQDLLAKAKPIDEVTKANASAEPLLRAWLAENDREASTIAALPVVSPRADLAMLVDTSTGKPLDAVPLDIW